MPGSRRQQPRASMGLFDSVNESTVQQNGRWTAAGTATVRQLLDATNRAPDDDYGRPTDVQRPLHKGHCEEIKRYYQDVTNWVIPAFVFTCESGSLDIRDGKFQGFTSEFQVLDGQHRIQALHLLKEELAPRQDEHSQRKLENLLESHVTLQYVENRSPMDAAQLFVDLNKSRRITATELTFLDSRNPVVNVVRDALESAGWVKNLTDTTRTRPAADSNDVLTGAMLIAVLRSIEAGVRRSISRAARNRMETDAGRAEAAGKLTEFLEWLAAARHEWQSLRDGNPVEVPYQRTRHHAYDGPFINLLAQAWSNSRDSGPDPEMLSQAVQRMNLLRSDPANDLKQMGLTDDRGRLMPPAKVDYERASQSIRQAAQGNR